MHDFIRGMHPIAVKAVFAVKSIIAAGFVSDPGPN
jgi:hypothetical protein